MEHRSHILRDAIRLETLWQCDESDENMEIRNNAQSKHCEFPHNAERNHFRVEQAVHKGMLIVQMLAEARHTGSGRSQNF